MNLSKFFIENSKFTAVVTIGLLLFGFSGLLGLNAEQYPSVDIGAANITTRYPGASAEDIEAKITKPIEEEIRQISGLKEVRSVSQPGLSRIYTYVDIDNYNVDEVISDMQRAMDRASGLPADLENPPNFMEIKSDEFPIVELAVLGSNKDRLRDRVADELKEELEDNRNISSVTLMGYRERQFNILVNKEKLDQYHVGLNEITQKLASQNVNIPGGNIEGSESQFLLKIEGKLESQQALENMIIRSNFSGERIRLGDVANVEDGQEDANILAYYNNQPATVLIIAKKGGADIIELSKEMDAAIARVEAKYDNKIDAVIFNNEGTKVENKLSVLSSNGITGLILVVALLMLFLPGRVGFMASLSLPIVVLAALGFMLAYGLSLNTITILALVISLGMLVDNSVVISENFTRLRSEGSSPKEAALESISDLWLPITATALTTIAAFLPMLVTKGIIGQFIIGIPIIVTATLILSLGESFFLLPVRLVNFDKAKQKSAKKKDWYTQNVIPFFNSMIDRLLRYRYVVAGVFSLLLAGSIFMMGYANKFVLFPADQTEIYVARVVMPAGTLIEQTSETLANLSTKIKQELGDDVSGITATAGFSEIGPGDPKTRRGDDIGMIRMFMEKEAKNRLVTNEVLARLRKIDLPESKTLSFEAQVNGPPVGDPITGNFRSNDIKQLETATQEVFAEMEKVEGVYNLQINDVYGEEEVFVKVNNARAQRLGLDLSQIGNTVRTAVAGLRVGDVNLNNKEVDYFVRLEDEDRASVAGLEDIKIMDQGGNLIPLSTVASFEKRPGSAQIKRFDFKPAKTITGNVNDEIITAAEANAVLLKKFEDIASKYKDVSLKFGGEGERIKESMSSLAQAMVLSIVGIFALLVLLFKSYLRPIIILTTIPLGLVGVSVSFYLHGRPISFMAMIGVIGLGGIIVNSGIVLISFIEQMRERTKLNLNEILKKATTMRLRAVLVTSLTTVGGLLPTAYGIGGSDEFIIPLTLAMAWGLVSGTLLALLWVPCAYLITEDFTRIFKSKKTKMNIEKNLEPKIDRSVSDFKEVNP